MKKTIAACMAALLICTGCQTAGEQEAAATPPAASSTPTATPAAAKPAQGGKIAMSMRTPQTLNPLLNEDATVDAILRLVFEPLAVPDAALKPVPNPALVKSIETSPDGMSVLITLLPDAKWSDGEPVTAKDIEHSVAALRNAPDGAVYKASAGNIAAVELVGDKAARLNLAQPFGAMAYMLMFPLIPAHRAVTVDIEPSEAIGNGVYTVTGYNAADALILTASETAAVRPYINEITVRIIPDRASELSAFDQGIIQAVAPGLSDWTRYLSAQDVRVSKYVTTCFELVGFNFEKEAMQNADVRRLTASIAGDEAFLSALFLDSAVRAAAPVSPESWLYAKDTPTPTANKQSAVIALAGQEVRILVNEENTERVRIAEHLAEGLRKEGISTARVQALPFDAYQKALAAGDFEMFVGGYNLSLAPELSFLFHSENAGGTNLFRYQNETMDALLAAAFAATGDLNLRRAMDELQRYIAEDLPCVGLVFRKSALLTSASIYAEPEPVEQALFTGIEAWFVEVQ